MAEHKCQLEGDRTTESCIHLVQLWMAPADAGLSNTARQIAQGHGRSISIISELSIL